MKGPTDPVEATRGADRRRKAVRIGHAAANDRERLFEVETRRGTFVMPTELSSLGRAHIR